MIREYVAVIAEVAATLEPGTEDITEREEKFEALIDRFEATEDPIRHGMATVMLSFLAGLFVGEQEYEAIKDNLDLERWFRLPKSHERRIHGHRHAGIRLVLEGPTLVHALDAHAAHPGPFTVDDLLPYRAAREPPCQTEARNRRTIMRKARSKKNRPYSWPTWSDVELRVLGGLPLPSGRLRRGDLAVAPPRRSPSSRWLVELTRDRYGDKHVSLVPKQR